MRLSSGLLKEAFRSEVVTGTIASFFDGFFKGKSFSKHGLTRLISAVIALFWGRSRIYRIIIEFVFISILIPRFITLINRLIEKVIK